MTEVMLFKNQFSRDLSGDFVSLLSEWVINDKCLVKHSATGVNQSNHRRNNDYPTNLTSPDLT